MNKDIDKIAELIVNYVKMVLDCECYKKQQFLTNLKLYDNIVFTSKMSFNKNYIGSEKDEKTKQNK